MGFLPGNQKGIAHLLLIGAVGIIIFLTLSSIFPLLDFRLNHLFLKDRVFAAGDGIGIGNINLSPTFKSVGIEVLFSGDDNRNATATLEFKKSSDTSWRQGLDLWRVDPADAATPIDTLGRAFYGSVLVLDANTSYDIKVTVIDPDGGGNVVTGTVSTRNDNIPAASTLTPTHFVRSDGNDANSGTSDSANSAWKTLQKAVISAPAGAIVQVGPGYYLPATMIRVAPITFKAQFPAVDDNRNIINSGQHSVIEPGVAATGLSAVSCPASASDCSYKAVWQRVTGLPAPGLAGDGITAGSLLPESVDPNIAIWKWVGSPIISPILMGYSATRAGEPQRIAQWAIPAASTINNPAGFIEKLISNKTYSYGFSSFNSGNDLYLRLPPNAPSKDPNDLYITLGSNATMRTALNLRGDGSRVTGFEVRNFQEGITITPSGVGAVIDHNLTTGNRSGIYFQANAPDGYGKDSVVEYNLIKDSNLWTDDHTNKPAIAWNFIKQPSITNADNSSYAISKPGQNSESSGLNGRGGAMNTVIRHNTIDGPFNGIVPGYQPGYNRYAGYNNDIHDNLITHIGDDAIEPEEQSINLKVWNNKIVQTLTFLSTGPAKFGPMYIFRNTAFRVNNAGSGVTNNGLVAAGTHFKYSGNSIPNARVYVINNTFWNDTGATPGGGQYASGTAAAERFYMRNNIFRTTHYAFDITANSRDGNKAWNEDYNYFYTSDLARTFKWNNTALPNLANYRTTTGQGAHTNIADTAGNVHTSPDSWLNNPATEDLSLNSTTAVGKLIDMGVSVPNIADSFNGCAPDLGATEAASSPCPTPTPSPTPAPSSTPTPTPSPSLTPTPTPTPTSTPVPAAHDVYRLIHPQIYYHFYTLSPELRDYAIATWGYKADGSTFKGFENAAADPEAVAVYDMFHPYGDHFYTINAQEKDAVVQYYGYTYLGIAFYAYTTPGPNRVPVYRLTNNRYDHFYTASTAERDAAIAYYGYWLEATAFYAPL